MENVVEQYLRNIEQFIKSNADSKKIDNIKVYLKNQAEIIYGIPMKKLKYLLTMFCLILMPKVVKAEMHLICPSNVIGGNTLSCALEVTDKYKSVSGTLDVPSTIKYVGIYGGTYTNLSAENGLYLRNDKLVGADIIGYLHFDTQEVANNTTIEIIIKSSSYVYSDDTKSAETDIKRLVTLTPVTA